MKKNNKHRIFAVESLNAIRKFDDDRYDKDDCNQASEMSIFFILAAHNLLLWLFSTYCILFCSLASTFSYVKTSPSEPTIHHDISFIVAII